MTRKAMDTAIRIDLMTDDEGYISQECSFCHWRFKVYKDDIGKDIIKNCPYCACESDSFLTCEQRNYSRSVAINRVKQLMNREIADLAERNEFIQIGSLFRPDLLSPPPMEPCWPNNKQQTPCCGVSIKLDELYAGTAYCPACKGQFCVNPYVKVSEMKEYMAFQRSYRKLKEFADNVNNANRSNFQSNLSIFTRLYT